MGDWKSDAYKKYIVNDLSDRLKVANKIKKIVICQVRQNVQFLLISDTKTATLITDSIGKHIYLKKCALQAFPGVGIIDVINLINRGIIKLHFDIIIIHVGTNNIWNYNLRDFEKIITSWSQM